ncbi:chromate efflux transporter [Sulfitobacter mediterraneus]|uniref:chromate efflux transporter n=1 Tax=Sulfitobacter mediterraneus TaxID=83219 RepID=UPI001931739E|nr:chromate efflux transporter [Sulfitobacter mediterraneus]MBM1309080.1 chromate efflux transporter [Sulfitobacter mediterraneus]MBM1312964.1 chromate efflux transporter [Sulfitobacter mediterraneus]MBM1321348.1 chromate efflux transporter [Sulfitobacter mediterraneus]MBM1325235.1 chromate efflux transporter [Sulfitobacter mediterraneus]MBM1396582.1 chromate efflux transporter [Sulfitobacter mediterraneus]
MSAPNWAEMTRIFGRIGLLSFGGPAAQIALMHRELVEERPWLDEDSYLRALSLCMLLPGPEAMQLATYAGWRMRGVAGGLLAGLLFVVPGAIVIAALALGYAYFGQLPLVQAAFLGIKAAVIVVVFQALRKVAGKALHGAQGWALALLSFLALFVFGLPFPLIILAAGLWGMFAAQNAARPQTNANPPARAAHSLRTIAIWGGLWAAPLIAVWLLDDPFLLQLGLFFSKLAVVTFGGAYAVLAYMTQTVVQDFGWISTDQMIDALGLAETTPGPLILVTEFVALLAGFAQSGVTGAIAAGLIALWVTFTPCFLWIFLAGPYLEQISAQPRLAGALQAITAAVVGVIANLSVWFALHILFDQIRSGTALAIPTPEWSSFNGLAAAFTIAAAILMLGVKRGFVLSMTVLALAALVIALL